MIDYNYVVVHSILRRRARTMGITTYSCCCFISRPKCYTQNNIVSQLVFSAHARATSNSEHLYFTIGRPKWIGYLYTDTLTSNDLFHAQMLKVLKVAIFAVCYLVISLTETTRLENVGLSGHFNNNIASAQCYRHSDKINVIYV